MPVLRMKEPDVRVSWPVGLVARFIEEQVRGTDIVDRRLRDGLVKEMLAECPMEMGLNCILLLLP